MKDTNERTITAFFDGAFSHRIKIEEWEDVPSSLVVRQDGYITEYMPVRAQVPGGKMESVGIMKEAMRIESVLPYRHTTD